jgi:hypothetical protein
MHEIEFRTLDELINYDHSYVASFKQELHSIREGIWSDLEKVPTLEPDAQHKVVIYLLELACQCQNMMNIELGRAGLLALPREWLVARFVTDAEPLLLLDEEWAFGRLLEVAYRLGAAPYRTLLERGASSENSEIRARVQDELRER